tara:strand:- start:858 stop:1175 length:318 start_codon:yes stop_codon:yes gene_type:complete
MTLITKGMGAIIKGIAKKKPSKAFSVLEKKGYKKIKFTRPTAEGGTRTQTRMVGGEHKGFLYTPKMPRTKTGKGQGVLFTEKFKTMPKDPNVLPGQLKFKFKKNK